MTSAVDTTKAFLVFGRGANSNNPSDGQATGQITDGTTLTFRRFGTVGAVTLSWYVVEFSDNVSVQRGSADMTGNPPINVAITPVDTAKSFPIISYMAEGVNFDANDFMRAKITSGTTLQLSYNASNKTSTQIVEWQVVEYLDANVQTNTIDLTFSDADTQKTDTLSPGVNLAQSWLILSYECGATDCPGTSNVGAKMIRGSLTNGNTVAFDRSVTGPNVSLILTWYVVEFTDNTTVQAGSEAFTGTPTMATGTYAGDGTVARSITGLGFQPDVVIVKVDFSDGTDDDNSSAVIRTSTMAGADSKPMKGSQTLLPNLITSLDPDGFTVGNDERVNWAPGNCGGSCTYYWVAFKANPNVHVGTYTGNPLSQAVTGVGFSPEYVVVIPTNNQRVVQRTNQDVDSYQFWSGSALPGRITSLNADGFSVATSPSPSVNTNGVDYHYAAWNEVPGQLKVGTYVGNAAGQTVTGVGFRPSVVIVKGLSPDSFDPVHASMAMPAGTSLNFRSAANAGGITALQADGFQVGTAAEVDSAGSNYAYVAFGDSGETRTVALTPVSPGLSIATAAGEYMCGGQTNFQADDNIGVVSFDFDLVSPGKLAISRGTKGPSSADVGWFVITFSTPATAVTLSSFTAMGTAEAVDLSWTTASELQNLGFHLYRSVSKDGPFQRITSSLIPGLGSSPTGASYSYRDGGLSNGQTYYYRLEDVETTGKTESHGPVLATPGFESGEAPNDSSGGAPASGDGPGTRIRYGSPEGASFRVVERGSDYALLELVTPGFSAVVRSDGSVSLEVPGFDSRSVPGAPAVPVKHAFVEALVGRQVRIGSVTSSDLVGFDGLPVGAAEAPAMVVTALGTVTAGVSRTPARAAGRAVFPKRWARVLGTSFQGETKKAQVELAPIRYDPATGTTLLARRLVVRVEFRGVKTGERVLSAARGRRPLPVPRARSRGLVADLVTNEAGLYAVRYEDVFRSARGVSSSTLRLSRQGNAVAYHLEPNRAFFGPGSVLYFVSEGAKVNPWGEAIYELELGKTALRMQVLSGLPTGTSVSEYLDEKEWEENKYYQAGLLEATDLWLWDLLASPVTKSYPIVLNDLSPSSVSARLTVWLQGASDLAAHPDHHMRIYVNGQAVGEASWAGKTEQVVRCEVPPGILAEGPNTVSLENVDDTAAAHSLVFLNRFSLRYPRKLVATLGSLEGTFEESGTAQVAGIGAGFVLDRQDQQQQQQWLGNVRATAGNLSFRVEAGHRYLAVAPTAVKAPQVRRATNNSLRSTSNRADWLLVAPQQFLHVAQPLADLRRSQGLKVKLVSLEDVYQEFGFGEPSPGALKAFLAYAYQNWRRPSFKYVVLLGDGSYDPKGYLKTGVKDWIPSLVLKTSYLWTASDPAYASLNGEDLLPDVAVGRLSASSVEQARLLVDKIVAFETAGRTLGGKIVLVADNADSGGNFEAGADELAAGVLAGREVERVYLRDLGGGTRPTIVSAFDSGAGIVSYAGHGGTVVWASENVFNNLDVGSLAPQVNQPLLLTMNCLNGFFHFPSVDSLAEALVKAEGKGAIAAFSPSGLSLNAAAHAYEEALLVEIQSRRHRRLGDAILAAQSVYADSGWMPELLSVYHLFGDPALKIE